MKIDDGGSAFPQALDYDHAYAGTHGMSLRDYFAAQALIGLTTNAETWNMNGRLASMAYWFADAMLAARKAVPDGSSM